MKINVISLMGSTSYRNVFGYVIIKLDRVQTAHPEVVSASSAHAATTVTLARQSVVV